MSGSAAVAKKKKITRNRKPSNYALCWVTETKEERDGDKVIVPSQTCYVQMPLPPTIEDKQRRTRNGIKSAVKQAVFKHGLKEYGNKKLIVVSYDEPFEFNFVEEKVTRLRPPKDGEQPGATVVSERVEGTSTGNTDDVADDDDEEIEIDEGDEDDEG